MTTLKTDRRYIELTRQVTPIANIGAMAIALLIVASCATSWPRFLVALGLHLVLIPTNIVITAFVMPKFGPRAEIYRTILNGIVCGIGYGYIQWPLAVWLWLPYVTLTFDQSGGKNVVAMVALTAIIQDATALLAGVHWSYPLTFTLLAALCWQISRARFSVIRDMLVRAEDQRDQLARAELELRQAQKLEAIGRLAAGVAHEINTPMQFVGASLEFVRESLDDVFAVQAAVSRATAAPVDELPRAFAEITRLADELDLEYLTVEMPRALALAHEGCARVTSLVRSMRQFAAPQDVTQLDINEALDTTLAISRHEYALVADVTKQLAPIPPLACNSGELNQVLLNLIVNAAHAIEDVVGASGERGTIEVATRREGARAVIAISDSGGGIKAEIRERIFEPFFTTKPVGRGTGQGLSISRAIIERYGGTLTFSSELGKGTTFEVCLPLAA